MSGKGFGRGFGKGMRGLRSAIGPCVVALGTGVVLAVVFPSGLTILVLGVVVVGVGVCICC